MSGARIVSFLPSATEMVFALGLGEQLVGRSHECDWPPDAHGKPVVVRPAIPLEGLSAREIDRAVSERIQSGASLYEVDEALLRELAPDLILTQDLCQVCAPSGNEVAQVLQSLPRTPQILWLTPKSFGGICDNLRQVAAATNREPRAEQLIAEWRARVEQVASVSRQLPRPRVFCMEWLEPIYCGGHWLPEMVEMAGGVDALGRKGSDSVRIAWGDVLKWGPEVVIVSPCGYHLERTMRLAQSLAALPQWNELPAVQSERVFAVDADAYFARPGPRVVDGVELLAHLIHPSAFLWSGSSPAYSQLKTKTCESCSRPFLCGTEGCWCATINAPGEVLHSLQSRYSDCLCTSCLVARTAEASRQ